MKRVGSVGIAVFLSFALAGAAAPVDAQRGQQGSKKAKSEQRARAQQAQRDPGQQQAARQRDRNAQQQRQMQVQQQQTSQRLSRERQQALIGQQRQRLVQYRQRLDRRQQEQAPSVVLLRRQHRTSQYTQQTSYVERMSQQRMRFDRNRDRDYASDPYFYTPATVRYSRGGNYYETNQYGVSVLQQAVNYGYEEGFRTGRADRRDGWRSSYRDSYAYNDADYGYEGYYVDQDEYNYYFREGFRRGYEDGFARRHRYGRYTNGKYTVLGAILGQILDFQSLR